MFGGSKDNFLIHTELLQLGQTTDLDLYCQQLIKLSEAVKKKRSALKKSRAVFF